MTARVSPAAMVVAAWALFAVLAIWLTARGGGVSLGTDAAMRLVGLRDLLAGQGWYDTAQHRMNTPFGLPMHWSRLADLGPAVLMVLLRPVTGVPRAEMAMLYIWPLLTFLPVLLALARIAGHMAGRAAAVMVLPLTLLCVQSFGLFAPGGIDHHNLQVGLTLWTLVFLIEKRAAAAFTIAASLAIGLETLPYAIAAILTASLWLGEGNSRAARFGLLLAGSAWLLLFGVTARSAWFAPVCDTYSQFYAALLVAGGTGLALVALLPRGRLLGFAALTVGVLGLAWLFNTQCFGGPYAGMSAQMHTIFLSRINEARPAFDFMRFAPSEFVAGYCYAAAALLALLLLPRNRAVLLGTAFVVVALATATLQIREAGFAVMLGLPGLAAMLATYVLPRGLVPAALSLLLASGATFALAGASMEGDDHQAARIRAFDRQVACGEPRGIVALSGLPPGRVAGFVDQGPAILAYTPHAAIAGPYHRDAAGITDTYAIFTGTPDRARAVLKRRGINYLMACSAAPDWSYYIGQAPDGLLARLAKKNLPDWLTPVGRAGDVTVWRVK